MLREIHWRRRESVLQEENFKKIIKTSQQYSVTTSLHGLASEFDGLKIKSPVFAFWTTSDFKTRTSPKNPIKY